MFIRNLFIAWVLTAFSEVSMGSRDNHYSDVELMRNLIDTQCTAFLYGELNITESEMAITVSGECTENYLSVFYETMDSEFFIRLFIKMAISNRVEVMHKYFRLSLDRYSKLDIQKMLEDSCFISTKILTFERVYSEKYNDFDDIKIRLKDYCS